MKEDFLKNLRYFSTLPYKKGSYKSRAWGHPIHSLLSYPSKLKPSIAYFLVKLFSKPGDTILDPFSGSGTIPFEACLQGRKGVGVDIQPLAYFSTKAKVYGITLNELEKQLATLSKTIQKNKSKSYNVEDEIKEYYHKNTLSEILAAKSFLLKSKNDYSFLISCLAHILHGNRPYALSRRSHNIMPWPPKGPTIYKNLIEKLTEKVHRMKSDALNNDFVKGESYQREVTNLGFKSNSMDSIITSPPFIYNRDFLRMNRIRLWFCGWDFKKQQLMRDSFIENIPDISLYSKVFQEFHRVLKKNSLCILHLGIVKNLDMAKELSVVAKESKFNVLKIKNEDSTSLESHGIRDRGATHTHQFLFLRKN